MRYRSSAVAPKPVSSASEDIKRAHVQNAHLIQVFPRETRVLQLLFPGGASYVAEQYEQKSNTHLEVSDKTELEGNTHSLVTGHDRDSTTFPTELAALPSELALNE